MGVWMTVPHGCCGLPPWVDMWMTAPHGCCSLPPWMGVWMTAPHGCCCLPPWVDDSPTHMLRPSPMGEYVGVHLADGFPWAGRWVTLAYHLYPAHHHPPPTVTRLQGSCSRQWVHIALRSLAQWVQTTNTRPTLLRQTTKIPCKQRGTQDSILCNAITT